MKAKECTELGNQLADGMREGVFLKVTCPHCDYEMPITYDPVTAECNGVFVRCKGRNCKKLFEIRISTK